jgi:hypothetical protein
MLGDGLLHCDAQVADRRRGHDRDRRQVLRQLADAEGRDHRDADSRCHERDRGAVVVRLDDEAHLGARRHQHLAARALAQEPSWKSLVKRLRRESPDFEARWQRHEVKPMKNLTKRFRHETAGVFNFDYTYLWLGRRSQLRLTSYTPTDDETAAKLRQVFA